MARTPIALVSALAIAVALAGCGGGGGGSAPVVVPTATPTVSPVNPGRSTATITFQIPADPDTAPTSTGRTPRFISPGTDKLTLIIDGTKAFDKTPIFNTGGPQNYTSADGNTKVTLNNSYGSGYFTFVATLDTLPGTHKIGVALISGTPAIVMSEGEATYALSPGPNAAQALTLLGALGSGYVQCDTAAQNGANNGCSASFNTTTGLYTLTAIGADYNGFPIVGQTVNNVAVPFDNGGFSVVETDASAGTPQPVLTLTNNGPFLTPGTHISGPSGAWYVNGTFSYGQPFNVKCNVLGTATLGMTNSQQGPTSPLSGFSYIYLNNLNANYPASGPVPVGSKKPGDPYHAGVNPNAIYHLATVNCDANMQLTLN